MVLLGLALLSLFIWIYLLFERGGFWRFSKLQASANLKPRERCKVVAIIPARDEADVIRESLESLAKQDFDGELRVIVVDDNSSDQTGDLARAAGVKVLSGAPLPNGWTGKLWAMEQGLVVAEAMQADFFLFTDADIRHDPKNLASLVGMAQAWNLDLVSHMVKLHCKTWPEKLTIPAFVFFFFKLYPPNWIASSFSKVAGAAGGCILIRPTALYAIGGLTAIRNELIDDCSLAKIVKWGGGRLWLGLSAKTESIRPYRGLGEIEQMVARSAFRQLDHSPVLLMGTILGLLVTYVLPMALALGGHDVPENARLVAGVAWVIMTCCYLPTIRFYNLNPLWAVGLPLTACFYLCATVDSALRYWRGKGEWKGRPSDSHP